jgi:hypothetical protein
LPPANDRPIDSVASGSNSSASFLQDMFMEIHKDKAFTSDVDLYFSTLVIDWRNGSGKDDPNWVLNWWRSHESEYPIMSQVARDYLAIPAGEVDVERLFSSGRDLIGIRRNSLSIDTMRALMILKSLQTI